MPAKTRARPAKPQPKPRRRSVFERWVSGWAEQEYGPPPRAYVDAVERAIRKAVRAIVAKAMGG